MFSSSHYDNDVIICSPKIKREADNDDEYEPFKRLSCSSNGSGFKTPSMQRQMSATSQTNSTVKLNEFLDSAKCLCGRISTKFVPGCNHEYCISCLDDILNSTYKMCLHCGVQLVGNRANAYPDSLSFTRLSNIVKTTKKTVNRKKTGKY